MNILLEHGTEFMRLKPVNVLQAAEADLRLRERKVQRTAPPEQLYSFMQRHVLRARNSAHLIALAYFELPRATDKPSTVRLYHDRRLLRETLLELLLDEHQKDKPA